MEHTYRISVRIGDSSFEVESTDLTWLESKEKEYLSKLKERPSRPTSQPPQTEPLIIPQNLTINEFYKRYIKSNNITSRSDIAVFFVYYLQKILKRDSIKTADIIQCFADVSYPNYSNLNMADILNKAKKKALLNNVNNLWSLTITGEDFILNTITGAPK
jgi:hypothetical protein